MKCYTCHNIMNSVNSYFFSNNKKNSTTYPYVLISFIVNVSCFHIKIFLILHSPARVHGVISFSSLLQNRHSTISKKSMFWCYPFDHAVKKNKSKFHFIYGKKTICCLDQHLKVDEIKDIYILYQYYIDGKKIPLVKCNLIESGHSSEKRGLCQIKWLSEMLCFWNMTTQVVFFFRFSFHVTLFFL